MIAAALRAAHAAGALLRSSRATEVQHKGAVDLVTELDLACEAAIREALAGTGVPVHGEERGGAEGAALRWMVDPLDGTTNFVHGFPFYCVSIALVRDDRPELGVIYDPVRDRMYRAERGGGAFCDDAPIRVSAVPELGQALVASGFGYNRRDRAADYLRFVQVMLERAQGFRRAGAAAMDLALVAEGRTDGFWEFNLQPWDVAAGVVLVEEAGGQVSDIGGGPLSLNRPQILASNGQIHGPMRTALSPLLPF